MIVVVEFWFSFGVSKLENFGLSPFLSNQAVLRHIFTTSFGVSTQPIPQHCHARAAINYTNHRSCLFHLVILVVLHVIVLNVFI